MTVKMQARDIGPVNNPTGQLIGVLPSRGPNGQRGGSTRFRGIPDSFVKISNKGGLDTPNSFTIIFWVKPIGRGTILEYYPGGVKVSLPTRRTFQVLLRRRNGKPVRPVKSRRGIKPKLWNYMSITYDQKRGLVTLWNNGRPLVSRNRGWIRPKTNTDTVCIGGNSNSRRPFHGSISCVQIYPKALSGEQIKAVKDICIEPGRFTN